MTNDVFLIDTCIITLLTLKWLGALMIEHVFLQNSTYDFQDTVQTEVNGNVLAHFLGTDLE